MQGIYPLNIDATSPAPTARWRPLVNWLLVLPPALWQLLLALGAAVVAFLGWFAIVATGRFPDSWSDYIMAVLRYQWRIEAYLFGWTEHYPGFTPPAGHVDPGDNPAVLYCARPLERNRLTVALRAFMALPHYVVLYFVNLAAFVVLILAWFAVLLTGRWPEGMRRFVIGWLRWRFRVLGYLLLVTDVYPPFDFEA